MGTVNVVLGEDTRLNLILGQQLENAVTSVVFDFSAWQTTYGSGTLALSVQRPGDEMPYAVTLTTSGTDATWSVTNLDTAYKGVGHIQLTYTVGSAIKKSVVYKFTVYESLGANGEYPSPGQTWQEGIEDDIEGLRTDVDADHDELIDIREGADGVTYPSAGDAVRGQITDVKQDLDDNYVSKKGEHQVTPQNIEGMQYTKTTGEVEGDNIFTSDMLFAEGKYVVGDQSNTIGWSNDESFNAYCIPVEQNTKYKFTESRFVVLATGNTFGSPTIGSTQSNLSEIETGEATYLFLSINVNSISNIYVKPVTVDVVYSDFILPDWLVDNLPVPTVEEKPNLDDLETYLDDNYVAKKGEHQVTPQNLEGMQYTKTTVEVEGENIFDESMLFEEGYYVNIANGKITHGISATLNTYCIPVTEDTKYRFTWARFCALAKGNTLGADAVGTLEQNLTEIETDDAVYMFLTIYNTETNISVKEVTETATYTDFILPAWLKTDTSDIESGLETVEAEKVDKNGVWQIKPQNIDGVTVSGGNVLEDAERIYSTQTASPTDGYVIISSGNAIIQSSSNFCSFLIPVKPNTHYTANYSIRFAVLLKNLSTEGTRPVKYSTVIGSALANIISFDTGEADHIIVSWNYNSFPIDGFIISEGDTPTAEKTITLPDWLSGEDTPVVEKPRFATVTGNIASGGNLQLTSLRNNLRKGERIIFEGKITSFSTLTIGLTYGTSLDATQLNNYFVIDGTNISYQATNTSTAITVAHGLTFSDNIQIIWEMSAVATCKITLISDGNLFSHEFQNFVRQTIGNPFVLSDGTVLTDCKLTWTCADIDKDIWMFGDSYFAYSDARWTYYLHQYGYDQNCLIDGFPGEGGVNGRVSFNHLLQYGTPKFAVWCLGMNDTSDSDSTPATNWVTNRDYFLQYCQDNNVTPIFGTIPTVPSINHEQKNAWIRSSGYRYIDFAKAVGASSSGVWFSGMLSSDNVHPTPQGARALFARVLLDLPEIMLDDWR